MKDWEISQTDLAKPVGVWAVSQPWILRGEQSGLLTHTATGKRFVVRADEKLSAFVELERQVLTVTFYLESINDGNGNQTAPLGLESF